MRALARDGSEGDPERQMVDAEPTTKSVLTSKATGSRPPPKVRLELEVLQLAAECTAEARRVFGR